MRVWLVTGTSSGFVSFIVDEALDRGDKVLIASPTPDTLPASLRHPRPNLALHRLDGTDDAHAEQAVHATVTAFGRIDVVLTIAGLGLVGAIEEVSDAELRMMFTTNVFDQLTTVRAALPVLRAQRAGHLIVMSALGGSSELPGWGVYQATKFASQGICEALSTELRPLGIGVTYLEPGL
ncbi:MAG: SDR family NAD(P)-dependent oxidoreductase, partial [Mycobacterium sp.]